MSSLSSLLAFLLCVVTRLRPIQSWPNPSDCSWTDPKYGVKFNYYALSLSTGGQLSYYSVLDSIRDYANEPVYTYYFNLCAPILSYPEGNAPCDGPSDGTFYTYCEADKINTTGTPHTCEQPSSERLPINGKAYAYQVKSTDDECFPLSSTKSDTYSVSLYDALDPTQGISIAYTNGAWADDCGANREFKVHLKCEDDPSTVPRQSDVIEYAKCKYELTLYTMHGCPSSCPAYANSLCAAQGLCGYDFATNRSRCFCYFGHYGSACERTTLVGYDMQWYHPSYAQTTHTGAHVETFATRKAVTDALTGQLVNKIVNVSYDLTDAHNYETVYQINDTAASNLYDYQFYFNIGGTVDSKLLPTACHNVLEPCIPLSNLSVCNDRALRNKSDPNGGWFAPQTVGYAYRFTKGTKDTEDDDECILLGTEMVKPWVLYDTEDNPAHGVKLEYQNGSYSYADELNCGISINLICPDTRLSFVEPKTGIVLSKSEVIDHGECQYEASFETAFACPYNCIVQDKKHNTFSVCNGRGMCIADPAIGFVRCVCDEKYYGDHCGHEIKTVDMTQGTPKKHSDVGFNVAIVIISLLLIVVVFAVVYLYKRNKTLEKYAVPILDEHEQIEPRVPDYSDSDSDHFRNRPRARNNEMVTMTLSGAFNNNKTESKSSKLREQVRAKFRKKSKGQYKNFSDDDEEDLSDDENAGPSAYLAANQDDSDTDGTD
eukprot:69966_1